MKKLTKFWGVFLAIVLASTLILSAAPVSAGTLSWGSEDLPDEFTDAAGDWVTDMAISGDDSVIYIAWTDAGNLIKRSTNSGESWSDISVDDGTTQLVATWIAVTPDDPNYIAAMDTSGVVFISDDAGANWDSLGACGATAPNDLDISVEKGGNHFVAVAGDSGAGAELFYYEIGAIGAGWTDAWTDMDAVDNVKEIDDDSVYAVAFSPNFYSDQVMVVVSFDASADEINYSMYSFNTSTWNSGAFSDFPKNLQQGSDDLVTMQSASLALAPDFLGSDDAMRVAFVGVAADPAAADDIESEGIFRMDDTDVEVLKDEQAIKSIDFDGDLLVAGHLEEVTIYRSTDPLESSPSVSSSTGTKEPGGVDTVIVGIVGDSVVATTQGAEAAFAYSEDNGKTFNDLSMIDTDIGSINDVVMTPDGSKVYLVTRATGGELSVWSLDERWERIYNDDSAGSDYIIRMAPDDSEVVYLGELGGTDMRFSSDGGFGKWQTRVYKESAGISDMAVETDGDTVYVLTSGGYVSKSTNRGFTWGSKKSSKVTGDDSISCMGEDMVVVGGDGRVSYSTDGNSSWTKLTNDGWAGGVTETKVVATGLNDGDFVIAADGDGVNAFELGSDDEWDDITPTSVNTSMACSGMQLVQGVLYVTAYDTAPITRDNSVLARTLNPTADDPTWSNIPKWDVKFDVDPLALSGSVDGDVTKLWAIDSGSAVAPPALRAPALFSYKDTLAVIGVDLSQPLDAGIIPFNPVSGASHQIIFTWTSPSDKVSKFDFVIATDSGFDEVVLDESVLKAGTWDEGDIISKIVGPGAAGNFAISFMPETTYYWRVRVNSEGPVRSAWSEVRSFTTGALPEAQPPVIIEQAPAPVIQAPEMPEIVVEAPEVVIPEQPAPEIVIPEQPAPAPAVPTWAIYAIIIIGAVLVIALIVLIMRTRRPV
jgi:hypothetical protein